MRDRSPQLRLAQRLAASPVLTSVLCVVLALPAIATAADRVDFNRDVRPILSNNCFACHGPDEATLSGELRLDKPDRATAPLPSGAVAIVPGKPDESELIARITAEDDSLRMPPAEFGKRLSPADIATLRKWIEQGAPYAVHWSYRPPQRPAVPPVPASHAAWAQNPIDHFTLQAMLARGLKPLPEADRYALVRRVFLDLTGLPPTIEETDAFAANNAPGAYEQLVEELLARPTFGEHWARKWLDLARYADSAGYADDPPRTIWAYRDWVIRAINSGMPFDQFTIEQIAGDLLPSPTEDQLIATAFHRNTLTNNEGGTQDEEFRNVAVVDRVNTTFAVWMGTTMACAQCHTHKYDPITQEEYFRFFAIFNNTADADRRDESPLLELYTPQQLEQRRELEAQIARLRESGDQEALEKATAALKEIKPYTTVPIMRELTDKPRQTRLQHRGNYLDLGPVVEPGVPQIFHPLPPDQPPNRLVVASWLVDRANPLTARVAANRLWESLFGQGIVASSEEFGSQGELPTHPELLDWLAVELMDSGWDTRHLIRLMVTSATYRQSSQVTPAAAAADPDNRWLTRGPRVRHSAEMIRDQALAASGLLCRKLYGPPVKPPQPKLGLSAAFGSSTDWTPSQGEDRYRRALYTTWRRSNPYPSMATFDAPNREVCTIRRNRTNTPLQSLVTLNDPVYVEAAQALARLALAQPGDEREQLIYAFRRCVLRHPTEEELTALVDLYRDALAHFAERPVEATKLATDPLGPLPPELKAQQAAAMTVVGNVLLNLDEMFLKR